jgi:phage terminase large subunit GpA-like protein
VDALVAETLYAWRPPKRLALSQWADEKFYLSAQSAAEPGRWRTLPYQREPMDCISDPHVEQVTFMKSARIGYTKMLNATIGYYMDNDPCPIMIVQPTIEDAEGYSKEEIAPMLRDCPALAALVPAAKAKDGENTILHKLFPGGSLSIVGANSARGFRRVSRKVVGFDEVDGYPPSAGTEGDQIKLGIRRTEYYWDRKIIYGSTPTIGGLSRIERLYLAGDQRRYYVPCPHCHERQVLKFPQFRWPDGQPRAAVYLCEHCGVEIEQVHQRDMVHAGEWRAHAPFTGHASFHLWSAYSFSPNATWGHLCEEFVAARTKPEELKTFVNTVLGEVWQDRGEAPDWERLYLQREPYASGTCPRGVLFLTVGVDVQRDRLIYEVVGWGRGKESWSIDAGVIPGDTSALDGRPDAPSPWTSLTAFLARRYRTELDIDLPIAMLAVDSGDQTQVVYSWARQHPMSRVIAVRGVSTATILIGTPSTVDVTVAGRKLKRGYKVWPVSVNIAKSELYGWLKMKRPTDEQLAADGRYPTGFCHFPEYGEDFFKQLTSEQLVPHTRRHRTVLRWEPIPGRENHYLDCRVYARAAAAVIGLDRFRDADWTSLERAVGETAHVEAARDAGQQSAASSPPTAAPPPKKKSWLEKPKPGGWIKGGR